MAEMTRTEFLNARLNEDEATAKACPLALWHVSIPPPYLNLAPRLCGNVNEHFSWHLAESVGLHDPFGASLIHAARHDPARVLREVEAKRKILTEYTRVVELRKSYPEGYDPNDYHGLYESGLEEVVTHLAAVYADHPDYQKED